MSRNMPPKPPGSSKKDKSKSKSKDSTKKAKSESSSKRKTVEDKPLEGETVEL
jgi:hypothetical protein